MRVAFGERRLYRERMEPRMDSGERWVKRGRRVGRQALIMARGGSMEVQITRG